MLPFLFFGFFAAIISLIISVAIGIRSISIFYLGLLALIEELVKLGAILFLTKNSESFKIEPREEKFTKKFLHLFFLAFFFAAGFESFEIILTWLNKKIAEQPLHFFWPFLIHFISGFFYIFLLSQKNALKWRIITVLLFLLAVIMHLWYNAVEFIKL